jgi:hypothetical protein
VGAIAGGEKRVILIIVSATIAVSLSKVEC